MMKITSLREHLTEIANSLTPESTIEDVYAHLSLLADIEESEKQEEEGETLTQNQVKEASLPAGQAGAKWLQ